MTCDSRSRRCGVFFVVCVCVTVIVFVRLVSLVWWTKIIIKPIHIKWNNKYLASISFVGVSRCSWSHSFAFPVIHYEKEIATTATKNKRNNNHLKGIVHIVLEFRGKWIGDAIRNERDFLWIFQLWVYYVGALRELSMALHAPVSFCLLFFSDLFCGWANTKQLALVNIYCVTCLSRDTFLSSWLCDVRSFVNALNPKHTHIISFSHIHSFDTHFFQMLFFCHCYATTVCHRTT